MDNKQELSAADWEETMRIHVKVMNAWSDGRCIWHDFLNAKDECDDCLDDAHETWLLSRGQS